MSRPLLTGRGSVRLLQLQDDCVSNASARVLAPADAPALTHALMTFAASAPTRTQPPGPQTVPIVILGTDAVLAALPSTAVQLAHACLRAGFATVIPASWGDELIAAAVLRRLPKFGNGPAIQCSCPIVAHRLLTVGGDLRPVILPLVPPPVAIARYIRALSQPGQPRLTYVGRCPGAIDESIDIRMTPEALFALLAERDIVIEDQPDVFDSIIPSDRRRFRSQPGGLPTAEALWSEPGSRTLVEVEGEDIVAEVAQHLLTGKSVLIDASVRLGCLCSGGVPGTAPKDARASVVAVEPPRATAPVVVEHAPIELDLHVPAASRTPVDVMAVPGTAATPPQSRPAISPRPELPLGHRISPVRSIAAQAESRPSRTSGPTLRSALPPVALVRPGEARSLPRTYVARRRSFPKGVALVPGPAAERPVDAKATNSVEPLEQARVPSAPAPAPAPDTTRAAAPVVAALPMRQLLLILGAVAVIAIGASAVVASIVGRSAGAASAAPAVTSPPRY